MTSRPNIPGGSFNDAPLPTYKSVDEYIEEKGDARYAGKSDTEEALAEKAAKIERVHLFDYIPADVQTSILLRTSDTDVTSYINDATAVLADAGGCEFLFPQGTIWAAGILLRSNIFFRGAGRRATIIKAPNGANKDVFVGDGAYALFGTNAYDGIEHFGVFDLTIDGNRANQSAVDPDACNGVAFYGQTPIFQGVQIKNALGHGIRSEWYQYGEAPMEGSFGDVIIDTVGRHGWWTKGPHDSHTNHMVVVDASQEADNTYCGIYTDGFSNGRFYNAHVWHRSTVTNRVKYAVSSGGANEFLGCHFEGGRSQLEHRGNNDKIIGCLIYAHFGAAGTTMVLDAGTGNLHLGNRYVGSAGIYGITLGVSGGAVASYSRIVAPIFTGFDLSKDIRDVNSANAVIDNPVNSTLSRGSFSVDHQVVRFQNNHTANAYASVLSGGYGNGISANSPYSVIGGGHTNVVNTSGFQVVGGGQENTAGGTYSVIPGGYRATTRTTYGKMAFASGYFATQGDAQQAVHVLRAATSDATAKRLTSDAGSAGSSNSIPLPNNGLYAVSGRVIARNTSTGDAKDWEIKATIKRGANAAATALVGTATVTSLNNDSGASAWALSVTADTTNGGVAVTGTGAAATSIRWVARVETVEVA